MTTKTQGPLPSDHIYRDLTLALALLFVSSPLLDKFFGSSRIESFLIAGFLIYALFQITRRRADLVIGLVLGVPAVASGIINAATPDTPTINAIPTIASAVTTATHRVKFCLLMAAPSIRIRNTGPRSG